MDTQKKRPEARKIGSEIEEFEIDKPIPVTVERTTRGRLIDLAWMVTATLIALTILNAVILPLIT